MSNKLNSNFNNLSITGLKENNFKNVDVSIPHDQFTVICGPSGSGKSTLAFDTIYAEGGRRYIETFSPYTRQFLDRLPAPDISSISNVRPALALEQRNRVTTSRSTVGTTTELNDYLKVLWSKVSELFCPSCGDKVIKYTPEVLFQEFTKIFKEKTISIAISFKVEWKDQTTFKTISEILNAEGFVRFFDPKTEEIYRLDSYVPNKKIKSFFAIIDRVSLDEDLNDAETKERLISGLAQGFLFGKGTLNIHIFNDGKFTETKSWSDSLSCKKCEINFTKSNPSLFSFNTAIGACDTCKGFGKILKLDERKVIPDDSLSIQEGAISFWQGEISKPLVKKLKDFCLENDISITLPWRKLPLTQRSLIIEGPPKKNRTKGGFIGLVPWFDTLLSKRHKMHVRIFMARFRSEMTCNVCEGTRLVKSSLNYKVKGKSLAEIWSLPLDENLVFFKELNVPQDKTTLTAHNEIISRLSYLNSVGLSYLTLDRQTKTLSGGEFQRVNLTSLLGSNLVNSTLVLDEPTIGLHPRDTERLISTIKELKDRGNTLVVVEHDPDVVMSSDNLIEIGPGSGSGGGEVVYSGLPKDVSKVDTPTGVYFKSFAAKPTDKTKITNTEKLTKKIKLETSNFEILDARANNLKNINVNFPVGKFSVVTGVSGSGKSSLVLDCLYNGSENKTLSSEIVSDFATLKNLNSFSNIILIDQAPIGKTTRANPGTYTKAWDVIRDYLAETDTAVKLGLNKSSFSFNVDGGRCPSCSGNGSIKVEMQFLTDVTIVCESCQGRRFQDHILSVMLGGMNVLNILHSPISDFVSHLDQLSDDSKNKKIKKLLQPLLDLGLGYLPLGHPLSSLSGGEAQRVKLASFLSSSESNSLIILDEPTTGLHPADVSNLIRCIKALIEKGHTVVCVEHNLDLIKSADWFVELGPDGGKNGGRLLHADYLSNLLNNKNKVSDTLTFLRKTSYDFKDKNLKEKKNLKKELNKDISIIGAREHNLKDITITIPENKITVITGISGSGKSTLAFDILFSEGQRRFLDCLSPYARQYIQQESRPDVDLIKNLPPTIAVSQKTAPPSGISTLATVTEIYQYLRLLYSKVGEQRCPNDGTKIGNANIDQITKDCVDRFLGHRLYIFAPMISGRKGHYSELFQRAARADIFEARIDNEFLKIDETTKLDRHKLHSISLLVGNIKVTQKSSLLLKEALGQALSLSGGTIEISIDDPWNAPEVFSLTRMCPKCGTGFLPLDPQDFSFRSQRGMCLTCNGRGMLSSGNFSSKTCHSCEGTRLSKIGRSVFIGDQSIHSLTQMTSPELSKFFDKHSFSQSLFPIVNPILRELTSLLSLIDSIGLGYLVLNRDASTLSGGEAQRLRLAKNLGSPLTGVCYILDEPSIGLHSHDHAQLMTTLNALKDLGNTIVVVEHDEDTIREAEHVIDIGPVGGTQGGNLVYSGDFKGLLKSKTSITAQALKARDNIKIKTEKKVFNDFISLKGASANNLNKIDVNIPKNSLVTVVGVSGAGKSSLVRSTLLPAMIEEFEGEKIREQFFSKTWESISGTENLKRVIEIDQNPIGKTSASTPASFLGVFNLIRDLFSTLPDAKAKGFSSSYFSYNTGKGKCPECGGKGYIKTPMSFLPDSVTSCEVCSGLRYCDQALEILFHGKSIGEVLNMTIEDAFNLFSAIPKLRRALDYAIQLGIGYICLGQPSHTLSGGEAQRLKIVKELSLREAVQTLYIMDEPTIGLHMHDVDRFIKVARKLTEFDNTVVIIEHSLDILLASDYIIEIGPGPASMGGNLLFQGGLSEFIKLKANTPTRIALKNYLKRDQ